MKLTIIIPWPPSLSVYYRHIAIGGAPRTLISKAGRDYRTRVVKECMAQKIGRTSGKLSVSIEAHVPDDRRRDLDNLQKAALDALTHAGVWTDDSDIDRLSIERKPKCRDGMLVVRVEAM